MRLVSFDDFTLGVLHGDEVVDVSPAVGEVARLPWDERMPALIAGFDLLRPAVQRLAEEAKGRPLAGVRLRAPLPRPGKILCDTVNYDAEPGKVDFTFKSPESIIGPEETVELPGAPASQFKAGAALALVIGREGKDVAAAAGLSYVFGYTAFIDVFGLDVGRPVGTYLAKSFDTFGPMGPCIVTADELPEASALLVRLLANGRPVQEYNTSTMANPIAVQIATATGFMTLRPGDVVTCGTPQEGVGPLRDGDDLRIEIDGIGGFRVGVRDPFKRTWG